MCHSHAKELQLLVRLVTDCAAHPLPCAAFSVNRRVARSIASPGTVQRGRSQTGNATDPPKPRNFNMHRPRSRCSRACCKACSCDCMWRLHVLTSLRLRHFPSALMGGRGSTKDFAFLLAPSLHRAGASGASRCNKDAKYKPRSSCTWTLSPSEALASVHAARLRMHGPRVRQETWGIRAKALQRILRSSYMMGRGWQLKAPNLDQSEPLRGNVLPAWSAGHCGKCSCGGVAAGSLTESVQRKCFIRNIRPKTPRRSPHTTK